MRICTQSMEDMATLRDWEDDAENASGSDDRIRSVPTGRVSLDPSRVRSTWNTLFSSDAKTVGSVKEESWDPQNCKRNCPQLQKSRSEC